MLVGIFTAHTLYKVTVACAILDRMTQLGMPNGYRIA
jgi:hypothetical protein